MKALHSIVVSNLVSRTSLVRPRAGAASPNAAVPSNSTSYSAAAALDPSLSGQRCPVASVYQQLWEAVTSVLQFRDSAITEATTARVQ